MVKDRVGRPRGSTLRARREAACEIRKGHQVVDLMIDRSDAISTVDAMQGEKGMMAGYANLLIPMSRSPNTDYAGLYSLRRPCLASLIPTPGLIPQFAHSRSLPLCP
jgi:hypothetical protein